MEIKTTADLKKVYPDLVRAVEDRVLSELGIDPDKGRSRFTEDEAIKLTDEEKKQIKVDARNIAGVGR